MTRPQCRLARHDILGLVIVKDLLLVDKEAKVPVCHLNMRSVPYLHSDIGLYDLLRLFEVGWLMGFSRHTPDGLQCLAHRPCIATCCEMGTSIAFGKHLIVGLRGRTMGHCTTPNERMCRCAA